MLEFRCVTYEDNHSLEENSDIDLVLGVQYGEVATNAVKPQNADYVFVSSKSFIVLGEVLGPLNRPTIWEKRGSAPYSYKASVKFSEYRHLRDFEEFIAGAIAKLHPTYKGDPLVYFKMGQHGARNREFSIGNNTHVTIMRNIGFAWFNDPIEEAMAYVDKWHDLKLQCEADQICKIAA